MFVDALISSSFISTIPKSNFESQKLYLRGTMKSLLRVSTFVAIYLVEAVAGAVSTVRIGTGPCVPSITSVPDSTASVVSSTSNDSQSPYVLLAGLSRLLLCD